MSISKRVFTTYEIEKNISLDRLYEITEQRLDYVVELWAEKNVFMTYISMFRKLVRSIPDFARTVLFIAIDNWEQPLDPDILVLYGYEKFSPNMLYRLLHHMVLKEPYYDVYERNLRLGKLVPKIVFSDKIKIGKRFVEILVIRLRNKDYQESIAYSLVNHLYHKYNAFYKEKIPEEIAELIIDEARENLHKLINEDDYYEDFNRTYKYIKNIERYAEKIEKMTKKNQAAYFI